MSEFHKPPGKLAFLLLAAVFGGCFLFLFMPFFTQDRLILNGDALIHSYSLKAYYKHLLSPANWRFWCEADAFGFPLYAEGQGAFFHPLNFVLTFFLSLNAAYSLFYAAGFFLAGVFAYLACRQLALAPLVCLFAAFGMSFAPGILWMTFNAAYLNTFAWSVCAFFAFEYWYARQGSFRAALGLCGALVLMILGGYAQITYATGLFLGMLLMVRLVLEPRRIITKLLSFTMANTLAMGLAGLQVLPLLELTAQSIRQGAVHVQVAIPTDFVLRGIFLVNDTSLYRAYEDSLTKGIQPTGGSLVVLFLLGFLPLLRNRRAISYAIVLVLFAQFARGDQSVFFTWCYNMLPGFNKFRSTLPFVWVTLTPLIILAGFVLNELGRQKISRPAWLICLLWLTGLLVYAASLTRHLEPGPLYISLAALILGGAMAATAGLHRIQKPQWLPVIMILLLVPEIIWLRAGINEFYPASLLASPQPLNQYLKKCQNRDPGLRFMHYDSREFALHVLALVFKGPNVKNYENLIRFNANVSSPYYHLVNGLNGIKSHNALPLARRQAVEAILHDEIRGQGMREPGNRFVDHFRIGHVILDGPVSNYSVTPDFKGFKPDLPWPVTVYENSHLQKRWQWSANPLSVENLADAVKAWKTSQARLVIEPRVEPWLPRGIVDWVIRIMARFHRPYVIIETDKQAPGYVFVPIPSYPGWVAWRDGTQARLRPANILGQALEVGSGRHRVVLKFIPVSFYVGLALTLFSLGICVIIFLTSARKVCDINKLDPDELRV